ncbi:hypothetical protein K461DRAFT_52149 [Myriangium duriaei CBS 260.36]|uniref:Uncharacterized protein n=1 Tax=Myriangium duriaei CBS 260.36 TaxID=1168546 RepID=A0A9P4MDB3_9PEZI|nr:hypothetical protein K461DRAFT_52149 [Myriangium duriaei CBS 260.36]
MTPRLVLMGRYPTPCPGVRIRFAKSPAAQDSGVTGQQAPQPGPAVCAGSRIGRGWRGADEAHTAAAMLDICSCSVTKDRAADGDSAANLRARTSRVSGACSEDRSGLYSRLKLNTDRSTTIIYIIPAPNATLGVTPAGADCDTIPHPSQCGATGSFNPRCAAWSPRAHALLAEGGANAYLHFPTRPRHGILRIVRHSTVSQSTHGHPPASLTPS